MKLMKRKLSGRRRRAGIIALVLAAAIMVTGTLAWQAISQRAVNNVGGEILPAGARLHDDFGLEDDPDFTKPLNKDVYIENYSGQNPLNTDDAGEPVFVRVKLMEYMETGVGAGLFTVSGNDPSDYQTLDQVDANGTRVEDAANEATSLVTGGSILNLSTWRPHVEDDASNPFTAYWSWAMGGTKAFMPTFNKDNTSLLTDRTENAHDKFTVGDKENGTANYASSIYDNNPEEHTAKDTLATAGIVSMAEWMSLKHPLEDTNGNGYWVGDIDGWYYWSNGLEAGDATALLLDQITLTGTLEGEFYYGIHVISEMATAGDWGDETASTGFYEKNLTTDGKFLLDQAAGLVEKPIISKVEEEATDYENFLSVTTSNSVEAPAVGGRYRVDGGAWVEYVGDNFPIYKYGEYEIQVISDMDVYSDSYLLSDLTFESISVTAKQTDDSNIFTNIPILGGNSKKEAFDKNALTQFHSENGINTAWLTNNKAYLTLKLEEPTVVNSYKMIPQNASGVVNRTPKDWTIHGSNDNTNWTLLDTQSGISWASETTIKEFEFANATPYLYYKMELTANGGESYTTFGELNYRYKKPIPPIINDIQETDSGYENTLVIDSNDNINLAGGRYRIDGETNWTEFSETDLIIYKYGNYEIQAKNVYGKYSESSFYDVTAPSISVASKQTDDSNVFTNIPILSGNSRKEAFDKNASTQFHSEIGIDTTWLTNNKAYLTLKLNEATVVNSYKMIPQNASGVVNRTPRDWTIQGSNDNTNWTILDTQSGISWASAGTIKEFDFVNSTPYLYYKMDITANGGENYTTFGELNYRFKK